MGEIFTREAEAVQVVEREARFRGFCCLDRLLLPLETDHSRVIHMQ